MCETSANICAEILKQKSALIERASLFNVSREDSMTHKSINVLGKNLLAKVCLFAYILASFWLQRPDAGNSKQFEAKSRLFNGNICS